MGSTQDLQRRQNIPIIYCRGSHFQVGYDTVGFQF